MKPAMRIDVPLSAVFGGALSAASRIFTSSALARGSSSCRFEISTLFIARAASQFFGINSGQVIWRGPSAKALGAASASNPQARADRRLITMNSPLHVGVSRASCARPARR